MYEFTCEKCGKTCKAKSDPNNWKGGKICFDCKNASSDSASKSSNAKPYTPPTQSFSIEDYIEGLIDIYESLKIRVTARNIDVPDSNIAQWATSVMIQKDKH